MVYEKMSKVVMMGEKVWSGKAGGLKFSLLLFTILLQSKQEHLSPGDLVLGVALDANSPWLGV